MEKNLILLGLLFIIMILLHKKENFNQSNLFNMNEIYHKLNTPNCKRNIYGDARNNTFCFDKKNIDHIDTIYNNNKYKYLHNNSYYYPPYLSTYLPHKIINSDWFHMK